MKIAPLLRAIDKHNRSDQLPITPVLVHTGQHYDYDMSQAFFQDLNLPEPDVYLGVGSGSHGEQTGKVMIEMEKVLVEQRPHLVVVVGDVNSTLAAALAAVKLHIPVAHVEAGLRSGDRAMPEEINRLLTDQISDYLFTPSSDADENLKREGVAEEKIFMVGNVMIDSLLYNRPLAEKSDILERLGLPREGYSLLTLHRPSNVDDSDTLTRIMGAITEIARSVPVVFPAHPRTMKNLQESGLLPEGPDEVDSPPLIASEARQSRTGLILTTPLSYLEFLRLQISACFVMTDSGGIQEETTVLNIPCLTLRDTTERPITITHGTNVLVGTDPEKMSHEAARILGSTPSCSDGQPPAYPPFWDGKSAERVMGVLARVLW